MNRCANCQFFVARFKSHAGLRDRGDGVMVGECHRYAPRAFSHPNTGQPFTGWPITREVDSCGEYQLRYEQPNISIVQDRAPR